MQVYVCVRVRVRVSPGESPVLCCHRRIPAAGRAPRGDTHLHVMRLAAVMLMAPDGGSFVAVCSPAVQTEVEPSICLSVYPSHGNGR